MKKLILLSTITILTLNVFAQGNSQKNKNKQKETSTWQKDKSHDGVYHNDVNNNSGKVSKNTPKKVGEAFRRDFPNATNVLWTKNTGSWTAQFNRGGIFNTNNSVTYKANGERLSSTGIF